MDNLSSFSRSLSFPLSSIFFVTKCNLFSSLSGILHKIYNILCRFLSLFPRLFQRRVKIRIIICSTVVQLRCDFQWFLNLSQKLMVAFLRATMDEEVELKFNIYFISILDLLLPAITWTEMRIWPVPARVQFSNGKLLTFRDARDFRYRICAHLSSESKQKSPDPLEYSKTDKSHGNVEKFLQSYQVCSRPQIELINVSNGVWIWCPFWKLLSSTIFIYAFFSFDVVIFGCIESK